MTRLHESNAGELSLVELYKAFNDAQANYETLHKTSAELGKEAQLVLNRIQGFVIDRTASLFSQCDQLLDGMSKDPGWLGSKANAKIKLQIENYKAAFAQAAQAAKVMNTAKGALMAVVDARCWEKVAQLDNQRSRHVAAITDFLTPFCNDAAEAKDLAEKCSKIVSLKNQIRDWGIRAGSPSSASVFTSDNEQEP